MADGADDMALVENHQWTKDLNVINLKTKAPAKSSQHFYPSSHIVGTSCEKERGSGTLK